MFENVLIIANPGSGKGLAPEYARMLKETLQENYPCEVALRETAEIGDATEWAKQARDDGFDAVMCLGGDGTVNEVISGLMLVEEPPLFSFVPLGTANDLGRVLGFDMNPDQAINQFKNLTEDVIDVGQVNDEFFIDIVAVGDIPTAVMETDSEMKNRFGFFAYVIDGAKAITNGDNKRFKVTNSEEEEFVFESNAVLVALTSSVGGMENLIEHREYKDGLFQFAALKGNVIASTLTTLANESGIPEEKINNETLLSFSDHSVRIEAVQVEGTDETMLSNVDGDEGPVLPLEIKVHKQAIRVLRPVVG